MEKTEQKNTPILLFLCLGQKQTSLDEFGQKKSESDEKVESGKKSLKFFQDFLTFRTFLSDQILKKKIGKRPIKKKAADK